MVRSTAAKQEEVDPVDADELPFFLDSATPKDPADLPIHTCELCDERYSLPSCVAPMLGPDYMQFFDMNTAPAARKKVGIDLTNPKVLGEDSDMAGDKVRPVCFQCAGLRLKGSRTAFVDDEKFAKKRLLSRHARYTGLLDKLEFLEASEPGALPEDRGVRVDRHVVPEGRVASMATTMHCDPN